MKRIPTVKAVEAVFSRRSPATAHRKPVTETRREVCSGLLEEAQRLHSKAAYIRDVNRAYPGEAHNFGAAFAAIADAHMALNLAAALCRPVSAPVLSRSDEPEAA
jgi:hypothetical protein